MNPIVPTSNRIVDLFTKKSSGEHPIPEEVIKKVIAEAKWSGPGVDVEDIDKRAVTPSSQEPKVDFSWSKPPKVEPEE